MLGIRKSLQHILDLEKILYFYPENFGSLNFGFLKLEIFKFNFHFNALVLIVDFNAARIIIFLSK